MRKVPDVFINIPSGEIDTSNIPDRTLPAIKLVRNTLTGDEFANKSLGHRKLDASGVDENQDPYPGRLILGYDSAGRKLGFLPSSDYKIGDMKVLAYQPSPLPSGWLPCDGRSLSRTTYSGLFALLSTTYGNVDSDTFNLPDMRGRVAVGKGATDAFSAIGKTGGTETHTLTTNEMPSHGHLTAADEMLTSFEAISATNYVARGFEPMTSSSAGYDLGGTATEASRGLTTETGGDAAHANLQPYIVMYHIIYTGITS